MSWRMPHKNPRSSRTLLRHIRFLVRLIMCNNICGFAKSPWGHVLTFGCFSESGMSHGRKEETIVQDGLLTEDGSDGARGDI